MTKKRKWMWIGSAIVVAAAIGGVINAFNPDVADTSASITTPTIAAAPLATQPAPPPAAAPAEPQTTPTPSNDVTPSGLTFGWATTACDNEGKAQFPYGFSGSWSWDGIHRVEGDTMFLKAGGKATNQYGTKARITIECTVSGTAGSPVVDKFQTY